MKNLNLVIFAFGIIIASSCEGFLPDSSIDLDIREDQASTSYVNLRAQGMVVYNYIPKGYDWLDGAMLAAATDEADYAPVGSDVEMFQKGLWNSSINPDNKWGTLYRGLRFSNLFLRNSTDYEQIIIRDTSTTSNLNMYKTQCEDLKCLRAEVNVLQAYMYFELLKRYGGVPVVEGILGLEDTPDIKRQSYDYVVRYILDVIDNTLPDLQEDWYAYDIKQFGRLTKGAALALKSRILLYWASPLNNPLDDKQRWKKAADAAYDVIALDRYRLEGNYESLFVGNTSHRSQEVIFSYMTGMNNTPEKNNYPITTNGGKTGICPSGNLVDSYENLDGSKFSWSDIRAGKKPYEDRDPRLLQSIVVNGSKWNGRVIETFVNGADGLNKPFATTTGYYMKKFLTDNLDLQKNQTTVHSWILFRYAEILLNFAEAMNEAYGPDADIFSGGRTARWAVNQVRKRAGMPPVVASDVDEMRKKIKHERKIELAFEDHRFWDVRRWGITDAKDALGTEITGIKIIPRNGSYSFEQFVVETRIFENKMMLYPIPQAEILRTGGKLKQNSGWN